MITIWLFINAKNGVSSYELARSICVTQKTGWFMLQRIRLALQGGSFDNPLEVKMEADETYIGAKFKGMNKRRCARYKGLHGNAVPPIPLSGRPVLPLQQVERI